MKYKGFTYTPAPKTAWDNLSMQEKSEMMKVAIRNGITDLKTIREKYNEFAGGGYLDWKEKASKYKHLDIDNDRTYDYEGWYNENPQRAWDFLNDSPDAHFDDKYKTVYHPTFSTQSRYSGIVDSAYNPQGLIGGTWDKQGSVFTMSPDGYRGPVSMDERKWYLENAEDNGVQLREADKSFPVFDGIPWGGVLPNVTVTGNKFAEGGNLYAGTSTDNDLVDWIIKEEGFTAKPTDIGDGKITLGSGLTSQKWHDLYKKRGNKWSETDNRSAVAQEVASRRRWAEKNIPNWDTLPESSQKALLAYKYNYDFNAANSPKLFKALRDSNLHEAARQINATSKDPRFQKGLMNRRKREQAWFLSDVGMPDVVPSSTPIIAQPVSTSVYNPYPVKIQNTTVAPRMVPDKDSYVKAHQLTEQEIRQQKLQERWDAINRFNTLMDMLNIQNNPLKQFTSNNPIFSGIEGLIHADGGKIHIKPENKGKFTALKERTGHSATWFKEHGTPAQKKMAVFALNSRHWKHGLGGNLFQNGGDENSMNYEHRGTIFDDDLKNQGITHVAELPEVVVRGKDYTKPYKSAFEYDPNFAKELPYFLPVVGDALDVADVAKDVYNGNYLSAGIGAGMLALPNFIEKPAKGVGKIIRKTTDAQKTQNIIDANKISKWTLKQWTAAQDAAIARGDMAEAQRLRDLHFEVNAPNTKISNTVYHGTDETFNQFDRNKIGTKTDYGVFGEGFYFSPTIEYARQYGDNVMPMYLNIENPYVGADAGGILSSKYIPGNPEKAYQSAYEVMLRRGKSVEEASRIANKHKQNVIDWNRKAEEMRSKGYNGIFANTEQMNSHEHQFVAFNPEQIKSADAVTYDNNGVRIPLGDRDNFNINDIRYGLLPFGIGLTGYGLLQGNSNKEQK